MTMIEQVARAICVEARINPDHWRIYGNYSRAAIEAMREPTNGTLNAWAEAPQDFFNWRAEATNDWQAMIDAALKEDKA